MRGILMDIANELRERGVLDEEECASSTQPSWVRQSSE
jgi:hypothetical protein